MFWISFRTYCFPVSAMVTTRTSEKVPITIPRAVMVARTLSARNESTAIARISRKTSVLLGDTVHEIERTFAGRGINRYLLPMSTNVTPAQTRRMPIQRCKLTRSPRKNLPPTAPTT